MKCLIVSGGTIEANDLVNYINAQEVKPYIIGVDGGCQVLYELGIVPNTILGDFDTLDQQVKGYFARQQVPIHQLDPIKDYTDTHAAFEEAKALGANAIDVFGFFGSRLDHSLGALLTAFKYSAQITIRFYDKHNIVFVVDGAYELTIYKTSKNLKRDFKYLSIIPIEKSYINETRNLKYPLKNAWLFAYDSYGVSNEIIEEQGTIDVQSGRLFVIQSND